MAWKQGRSMEGDGFNGTPANKNQQRNGRDVHAAEALGCERQAVDGRGSVRAVGPFGGHPAGAHNPPLCAAVPADVRGKPTLAAHALPGLGVGATGVGRGAGEDRRAGAG